MDEPTMDTSFLDSKTNEDENGDGDTQQTKIIKFIQTVVMSVLIIIAYFISSSGILYMCKLAQSNLLPTDLYCKPYTTHASTIEQIPSNIFQTTDENGTSVSMKIQFPQTKENMSNALLDECLKYQQTHDSHFLVNYLISIIQTIMASNYSVINYVFSKINDTKMIPEWSILLLGPIVASILFFGMSMFNQLYFVYLWFSKMSWFFKSNANAHDRSAAGPKWEDIGVNRPVELGIALLLCVVFFVLLFFLFPIVYLVNNALIGMSILSCLLFVGKMAAAAEDDDEVGVGTIMKLVFKYYKSLIMGIMSATIILISFSKLDNTNGLISSAVVLGMYAFMHLFKTDPMENVSEMVPNVQAQKKCMGGMAGKPLPANYSGLGNVMSLLSSNR